MNDSGLPPGFPGMMLVHRQEEPEPPPRPIIEAQIMELQARYKAFAKSPVQRFTPGTILEEKPGLGVIRRASLGSGPVVMMLFRYLDVENNEVDRIVVKDWVGRFHVNDLDCIVGILSADAEAILYMPHHTALLQRVKVTS